MVLLSWDGMTDMYKWFIIKDALFLFTIKDFNISSSSESDLSMMVVRIISYNVVVLIQDFLA